MDGLGHDQGLVDEPRKNIQQIELVQAVERDDRLGGLEREIAPKEYETEEQQTLKIG